MGRHPRPRTKDTLARTGARTSAHATINTNARTGGRARANARANARTNICFNRGARPSPPDKKIKATMDQIRPS